MVKSQCGKFEVKVVNKKEKKYYPEIHTCDGDFVIVQRDEIFEIEMHSQENEVFGSKLSIDGQELLQKKTWKHKGCFKGFKVGINQFKQFVFCLPQLHILEETDLQSYLQQNKETNDYKGKIEVGFFCTKQIQRNGPPRNLNQNTCNYDIYSPLQRNPDKKVYTHSLTVNKGETFQLEFKQNQDCNQEKENSQRIQDILLNEKPITKISIQYIDFIAAIAKGYISIDNPYHLQYIPDSYLHSNKEWVEKCFISFMKWFKDGLNVSMLEEKFNTYTKRKYCNLNLESLETFLSSRKNIFFQQEDGDFLLLQDQLNKKVQSQNLLPQDYFKVDGDVKKKQSIEQIKEQRINNQNLIQQQNNLEILIIDDDDNDLLDKKI